MTPADAPGPDDVPDRFQVDFNGQTLLGIYRVERRLADGGMGSVYLAEDTNLGRRVVVKVPHARFLGESGFRARFRREIEELVRLEHPHIVRILARGEQDGIPFFVLQYLGGGSLEDRLARGAVTPERTLEWFGTIAETLDFVHGRGIVHRDVKPANVLFDEEGHVFLSDFGVVKALGEDDGAALTAARTVIGSPVYMAPEQGLGHAVTPASDQYSLGSALYEALAGAPPFGRGSIVEILVRRGREEAPSLRASAPGVSEACAAAVARSLAREPADRFPTCGAFAAAFRQGLVAAPGAPAAPRTRAPVLVALALFAVLLGVGSATRMFGLWEPRAVAPAATPQAPATETPLHLLRLVERGAEPRRVLRWTLAPGRREARVVRTEYSEQDRLDDHPPQVKSGVTEQDYEIRVDAVDDAGRARLEWQFPPLRFPVVGGSPDATVALEKQAAAELGTVVGWSRVDPSGLPLEDSLRDDGKVGEVAALLRAMVQETMRESSVTLPDQSVGVGAGWEFTQIKRAPLLGVRYQEVSRYEVLAIDGQRVRLGFRFDADAPDQAMDVPGVPREAKARVNEFTSNGSGEALLDLERTVPLESKATGKVVYAADIPGPGGGKIRIERTFEMRVTPR